MKKDFGRHSVFSNSANILPILILVFIGLFTVNCAYNTYYENVDTNGRAQGVATQNQYAYVADGHRGLKIFNISNPKFVKQVGAVDLPGFNARVAVEGNIAVLTDTKQNSIYIVDISDKFKPQLKWTHTTLDKARAVAINEGIAFIAEKGDNPQAESYFSGLEAISCSLSNPPLSLKSISIKDISDVAVSSNHIYAVGKHSLTILARSSSGFNTTPLSTFNFSPAETIQSIDNRAGNYLLILGQNLYFVDITNPSKPVILDQTSVAGCSNNRVITSSGILTFYFSGHPWIYLFVPITLKDIVFLYSTLKEYGMGIIDLSSKKILSLKQLYDVDKESDGHAKLYDIEIHEYFNSMLSTGGIVGVGALDNYGLAYGRTEAIAFKLPSP
ncbi:MAG: LVIVD repeat-containing protein [Candidatus Aminicenantia bacterium]